MPTRPEESLAKMIASLKQTTGRTLDEWKALIAEKELQKHGEVMAFLKTEHGVSHGYANQIALRRNDQSAATEGADPIALVFEKKELARQIYDAIMVELQKLETDVDVAPKKSYVSLRRNKQFAIMQPAAARLDVGINLVGKDPNSRLEKSGSFNAMLSHRVRVASLQEVDAELLGWLREAYQKA